jgi:putative transposase
MKYNSDIHHRRTIRLQGYDYSQKGGYFVTIVTQNRECLFGNIEKGKMVLSKAGDMIRQIWCELPDTFFNIKLDEFIIMPNHIHGIIIVKASFVKKDKDEKSAYRKGAGTRPAFSGITIGDIVGSFKSITTHKYILGVKNYKWIRFYKKLWQRNYWEHIIRNDNELNSIREYIINNPLKWEIDEENPYNNICMQLK